MINLQKIKQNKTIQELINFGILNIDKPAGCTSFDVVNTVRKTLGLKKCGHFGTLDPNVTGVLPIALENACKIQEYFMHRNKTYIGKMQLHQEIDGKKLKAEMKKFIGKINQLPPRISRVKRQVRQREIVRFEILKFNKKKKEAEFIAEVEAGTYIRKLIDDLGKNIGGAQMIELRRLKAGLFSSEDKEFASLDDFKKAVEEYKNGDEEKLRQMIIPAEIITEILLSVEVKEEAVAKLGHGSPLFKVMLADTSYNGSIKIIESNEPFAVFYGEKILEIAKKTDHFENKEILAKAEAVLI